MKQTLYRKYLGLRYELCCIAIAALLEEALSGTARITLQAISSQEAAVQAVNFHAQKLREAMEDTQVSRSLIQEVLCFF